MGLGPTKEWGPIAGQGTPQQRLRNSTRTGSNRPMLSLIACPKPNSNSNPNPSLRFPEWSRHRHDRDGEIDTAKGFRPGDCGADRELYGGRGHSFPETRRATEVHTYTGIYIYVFWVQQYRRSRA